MKHGRWNVATYATFFLFYCMSVYADPVPQLLIERTDGNRPTLLVLGSTHFSNLGLDNIDVEVDDVLADARQSEIQALAEKLAEFRPTHIAVEVLHSNQDRFNSYYQDYVNGVAELDRSEASQIGLRLAKMLGHEHVYAVDWQGAPPGGFTDDYNWHDYGQANGHNDRVAALSNPELLGIGGYIQPGKRSIMEWIRDMNSEDALLAFHRMYFDVAQIGTEEYSPGAIWVGHWHVRNLMIFNNIVRLAQDTNDRVLVIYGASHAYSLNQFGIESGAFNVVKASDALQ